jgi:hypothetical protein
MRGIDPAGLLFEYSTTWWRTAVVDRLWRRRGARRRGVAALSFGLQVYERVPHIVCAGSHAAATRTTSLRGRVTHRQCSQGPRRLIHGGPRQNAEAASPGDAEGCRPAAVNCQGGQPEAPSGVDSPARPNPQCNSANWHHAHCPHAHGQHAHCPHTHCPHPAWAAHRTFRQRAIASDSPVVGHTHATHAHTASRSGSSGSTGRPHTIWWAPADAVRTSAGHTLRSRREDAVGAYENAFGAFQAALCRLRDCGGRCSRSGASRSTTGCRPPT